MRTVLTWTDARPTAARRASLKPSSFSNASSKSRPSGVSTEAQILMLSRNVAFCSISSLPILGHWLPLPAQEQHVAVTIHGRPVYSGVNYKRVLSQMCAILLVIAAAFRHSW